jgi:hypothetical protein
MFSICKNKSAKTQYSIISSQPSLTAIDVFWSVLQAVVVKSAVKGFTFIVITFQVVAGVG